MMVQNRAMLVVRVFLLVMLLVGLPGVVMAQDGGTGVPPDGAIMDDGQGSSSAAPGAPALAGGAGGPGVPDTFGYVWTEITPGWRNIRTTGTPLPLSGSDPLSGALDLGFSFPFFENTYSQVYVSGSGYLTFDGGQQQDNQSPLRVVQEPNNVIAPFWGPAEIGNVTAPAGVIYVEQDGTAPNRMFYVQWNQITQLGAQFSYQVVLFENGDIRFNWRTMSYPANGGYYCTTSGIEDSRGVDGLIIDSFCTRATSDRSVLITRPGPSARVLFSPQRSGQFVHPGQLAEYELTVTNTGDTGSADIFEISAEVDGPAGWEAQVVDAESGDPLADTNGTNGPDTGPIEERGSKNLRVLVQVPPMASIHDTASVTVRAVSAKNGSRQDSSNSTLTIPAPFVAAYMDRSDGIMRLDYNEPAQQRTILATGQGTMGSNPAVAELPDGSIFYAWNVERCLNESCSREVSEIQYSVYSRNGGLISGVNKLADYSSSTTNIFDRFPAVAATANGTVGMVFVRSTTDTSGREIHNVYFQRFNATGGRTGSAVNITGNTRALYPDYDDTVVTAVSASRFLIAYSSTTSDYQDNVHTALVNASTGALVAAPHQWTADTPGVTPGFGSPTLARLNGDRAALAYRKYGAAGSSDNNVFFGVLNSSNAAVIPVAPDAAWSQPGMMPDVVQLSDGNILLAWRNNVIQYAIFSGSGSYAPITPPPGGWPQSLTEMSSGSDMNAQVTADTMGDGIISWADSNSDEQFHFYYAAVDGETGALLAGPMIYKNSPNMMTSSDFGNSITSLSFNYSGPDSIDLSLSGEISLYAQGGGPYAVQVQFTNAGRVTAHNATLTAVVPAGMQVMGQTPAASCSGSGPTTCVWALGDVDFLDAGVVTLNVRVPGFDPDAHLTYPINFTISTSGGETDSAAANNTRTVTVFPSSVIILVPYVRR